MNPYWGKNLFSFIALFFERLFKAWPGGLASDELQILVMALVALTSALLGVFLILKRMTMLANSLSHTILLGIVLAYLLFSSQIDMGHLDIKVFIFGSLLSALLTTLLTEGLIRAARLQEDASIGIVFSSLFALGILIVTLFTRSTHIGLEAIMGNVEALHLNDLKMTGSLFFGNLLILILFFKEFRLSAFDASFAKLAGARPALFHYLLMVQLAATAIGAFRAVGVLLFLAFLVGPPLTARLFTKRLGHWLLLSAAFGAVYSFLGVAISRHLLSVYQYALSTSAIVVVLIGIGYLVAFFGMRAKLRRTACVFTNPARQT